MPVTDVVETKPDEGKSSSSDLLGCNGKNVSIWIELICSMDEEDFEGLVLEDGDGYEAADLLSLNLIAIKDGVARLTQFGRTLAIAT